jgi:hypothetical protein
MQPRDNLMIRRLAEDGMSVETVREKVRRSLPEPRQIPLDPATLVLDEVSALLSLTSPEGIWLSDLPAAEAAVSAEVSDFILRRTLVYAQEQELDLAGAAAAMAQAIGALSKEVDRKVREAESSFDRANSRLERKRERPEERDSPGLVDRLLGFADRVVGRAEAVKAWNDREMWAYRRDVQLTQRAVWQRLREVLQRLPERLKKLEATLVASEQEAALEEPVAGAAGSWSDNGVSSEPIQPLAACLTASDVDPALPADLLVALAGEERLALELLEEEATNVARRQTIRLRLGALERVHGSVVRTAGQEMLRELNQCADQDPYLFQIAERGPDGQLPAIWPAVHQQTAVVAAPGPAVLVGFLRVDRPVEIGRIQMTAPTSDGALAANAFVNLDLARRFHLAEREEEAQQVA